MAEADTTHPVDGAGKARAAGLSDWLGLAAAPVFATMALVTEISADGQPNLLCLSVQGALPLNGMVLMYLLMAAFHLPPWLRLFGRRPG